MPLRGRGAVRNNSRARTRNSNVRWEHYVPSGNRRTVSNDRGGRNSSRGRSRGSWDRRGRTDLRRNVSRNVRNASPRNDFSDRRTNDSSDNVSSILRTILHRLDDLETTRRPQSREWRPNNNRAPASSRASNAHNRPPSHPEERFTSSNPDFSRLVRTLFQFSQIAHHQVNWFDCPKSIARQIDLLIQQIQPPLATSQLHRSISIAANDFKTLLTSLVQQHLEDRSDFLLRDVTNLNTIDLDRACDVASRQLNTRLGKRLHKTQATDAMTEISSMLKRARSTATRRDPTLTAPNWTLVAGRSTKPLTSTTTTARVPVETSNRYDVLSDGAYPIITRPTTPLHITDTIVKQLPKPQRTSTTGAKPRSSLPSLQPPGPPSLPMASMMDTGRRQLPTTPPPTLSRQPSLSSTPPLFSPLRTSSIRPPAETTSARNPDAEHTLHQPSLFVRQDSATTSDNELCDWVDSCLRNPPPKPDIRTHTPTNKDEWKINSLKTGMSTVLIADSNGLSMAHSNLSDGWTLEIFRGARLLHVPAILKRSASVLRNIHSLIIAVCLNDRLSDPSIATTNIIETITWARENGKRLIFSSIPIVPDLPLPTKQAIVHLNDLAADLVDHFITVIDESEIKLVENDSSGLHYDNATAELIIGRIATFLFHGN